MSFYNKHMVLFVQNKKKVKKCTLERKSKAISKPYTYNMLNIINHTAFILMLIAKYAIC